MRWLLYLLTTASWRKLPYYQSNGNEEAVKQCNSCCLKTSCSTGISVLHQADILLFHDERRSELLPSTNPFVAVHFLLTHVCFVTTILFGVTRMLSFAPKVVAHTKLVLRLIQCQELTHCHCSSCQIIFIFH